jgi:hypothetical protein
MEKYSISVLKDANCASLALSLGKNGLFPVPFYKTSSGELQQYVKPGDALLVRTLDGTQKFLYVLGSTEGERHLLPDNSVFQEHVERILENFFKDHSGYLQADTKKKRDHAAQKLFEISDSLKRLFNLKRDLYQLGVDKDTVDLISDEFPGTQYEDIRIKRANPVSDLLQIVPEEIVDVAHNKQYGECWIGLGAGNSKHLELNSRVRTIDKDGTSRVTSEGSTFSGDLSGISSILRVQIGRREGETRNYGVRISLFK